jgi:putative aminophosphonate oxidoreductase
MRKHVTGEPVVAEVGDERAETRSLWLHEALADADDAPFLAGEERADVCLVGGGYTGLWCALGLKERAPELDVVLVEADVCGAGPSGRNGGFVLSWWAKFTTLEKRCGAEEAIRLARASAAAVADIGAFCDEHGIDAHYRPDGWLWTATNPAQVDAWKPTVDALAVHGERPFVELAPEEVADRAGSPRHLAGVFEPSAATVQPALLARGLRRVALERGVRIFEHSPVTRLERSTQPRVRTPRGAVSAERVVLATGAWTVQVRELRRALVVVSSDIVATDPVPERLEEIGLRDGLCISDSRLLVHYYRTTRDGRLAFGKGGGTIALGGRIGRAFHGVSPHSTAVDAGFRAIYPQLADVAAPWSWTGPIDRSLDGMPFFGRLCGREDIVYGAGYSGNGVGPSFLGGRILASLALGVDDEWAGAGLVGGPAGLFPPEPLRYVGGQAVRAAVARKERAEDEARRPSALAVGLARLAPAGLVPLKSRT